MKHPRTPALLCAAITLAGIFASCQQPVQGNGSTSTQHGSSQTEAEQLPVYESDGFAFTVTGISASIVGTVELYNGLTLTIPETLGGYPVTAIGEKAFYGNRQIERVELPDSITTIGDKAFAYCQSLQSIALPASLKAISGQAFYGCTSLEAIDIPQSTERIGTYAFAGCTRLSAVTVRDGLATVEYYAFGGCNSLTSIVIPASLAEGDFGYSGLKDVVLSDGIAIVPSFCNCKGLAHLEIPSSVMAIQAGAFSGTGITTIELPSSVTRIGDAAFSKTAITAIELPNGVTSIGDSAFEESALQTITLPESVMHIGKKAFYGCAQLGSVVLPQHVTVLEESTLQNCIALQSVTLPGDLTHIAKNCFYGDTSLAAITLPATFTELGDFAFKNCSSLTALTLPAGLTTLGKGTVAGTSVTELRIPATVTTLAERFLEGCDSLQTVYVGCNLGAGIGKSVFTGTPSTVEVVLEDGVTEIGQEVIGTLNVGTLRLSKTLRRIYAGGNGIHANSLYVQSTFDVELSGTYTKEDEQNGSLTTPWAQKDKTERYDVYFAESVESVGYRAFYKYTFTHIEVPASLKRAEQESFNWATFTESSFAFSQLEELGDYAFGHTEGAGMQTVELTACKHMEPTAFRGAAIDTLILGEATETCAVQNDSLTRLEVNCAEIQLAKCENLQQVVMGANVRRIMGGAFSGCKKLTTVSAMQNVAVVGKDAFKNCSAVERFDFYAASPVVVASGAFRNCASAEFSFANGITLAQNADNAFDGCKHLTELPALSPSSTHIPASAFAGTGLTTLAVPDTVLTLGNTAFSSCTALESITLHKGLTDLGIGAFSNCTALTTVSTYVAGDVARAYSCNIFGDCPIASIQIHYSGTTEAAVKALYLDATIPSEDPNLSANGFYTYAEQFSFQQN